MELLYDLRIQSWHEHTREDFSVNWSNVNCNNVPIASPAASWDGLVKMDLIATASAYECIKIFHTRLIFNANTAPSVPELMIPPTTFGGGSIERTWRRTRRRRQTGIKHRLEPHVLASGVSGHEYAVRKIWWSPHHADVLASSSCDITCDSSLLSLRLYCRFFPHSSPSSAFGSIHRSINSSYILSFTLRDSFKTFTPSTTTILLPPFFLRTI
ncbi:hypothetical protein BD410DRAFT_809065 [Rickenella mellea]|uniref:Uncharacterized protein n=1 Tax=Rickenella mellea TaxID=50990 RepID=A0A4Y7PJ60_9AGAM|nr:hypothetical protein BD410DRAFT_809065 [Rickenella mellea]